MNPAALLLGSDAGTLWLPPQLSTVAKEIDSLFNFVLWLNVFFLVLIVGILVYFVFKYLRKNGVEPVPSASHNTTIELVWSVGPLFIVLYVFYAGWTGYLNLRTPPGDAYEVNVTAQKWSWNFTYPNGYIDGTLHCTVGEKVRLQMASEDVLHSFYIPDFRVKMDVVPGRYTQLWFEATEPGTYRIYCTEYCGTEHSSMLSTVVVHPTREDFDAWMTEASNFVDKMPPIEAGERLYRQRGCTQCHSIDGSAGIGPSLAGVVIGSDRKLADGSTVKYSPDYIRQSILDPGSQVAEGFQPVMPTYQGRLKDKEITVLIEYIKSLNAE